METRADNLCSPLNTMSRVSWGAIFAGTFVAMFFQILLGLLGLAIGLSIVDPARGETAGPSIGIGAAVWLVIITLISVFAGTFTAGRLAGLSAKYDGLMHGVATLAFLTVLSVFMVSSGVSGVVGGALSLGVNAAQVPQVQQALPTGAQLQQPTGAAAPTMTPQQRQQAAQQADRYATTASWITFITALLSLVIAAIGGYIGMQSRVKQIIRESAAY